MAAGKRDQPGCLKSTAPAVLTGYLPEQGDGDAFRRLLLKMTPVPWRKLYRRDFLNAYGLRYPEGDFFFEDNPFHWFTTLKARRIVPLNELICHHRINRPGQTMKSTGEELLAFYQHYDCIAEWLREQGQLEAYERNLISWIVSNIEWTSSRMDRRIWSRLYQQVVRVMANHSAETIFDTLSENAVGNRGSMLVLAAKQGNQLEFVRALSGNIAAPPAEFVGEIRALARDLRVVKAEVPELQKRVVKLEQLLKGGLMLLSNGRA